MSKRRWSAVTALSGGIGGARLVDGLYRLLPPGSLTVIVNTGDDLLHWGLPIAPDLDTVMYTLAGIADAKRGWGLEGETFHTLEAMGRYGAPTWFQLGDRDLATHLMRAQALASGRTLSEATRELVSALGVTATLLPMADAPRRTMIDTEDHGTLPFQQWLVQRRAEPRVRCVRFEGTTAPAPGVVEAIESAEVVILPPSNPYVSIDPITSLEGVLPALRATRVVGVSPIVGGQAVKGPLAEMMPALTGEPASAGAVARHYEPFLDAFVAHPGDEAAIEGVAWHTTDVVMSDLPDRQRLAAEVLAFAEELG